MATRKRSTAAGVPPAATKPKPPPKPKAKAGASANGRARGPAAPRGPAATGAPAAARGPAAGGAGQDTVAAQDPVAATPSLGQVAPAADLLQRAVEEAASLLQADGAIIYLRDPADDVLRFAHDAGIDDLHGRAWVRRLELRPGQGMFGRAVAERRVVVTRDYPNDDSFPHAEATDRFVREVGLRSMIVAPLIAGDRVFGALGAFSLRADAFDAAQTGLVRSLADHAGGAMANALLIEELAGSRAEIERRADAERTVREIAARITAMRDADEILQYVTAAATRLLRATGGMMDLVGTPSAGMAWARSSDPAHPVDTSRLDATELELDAGVSGLALRTGQAQSTGDYLSDTRFEHRPTRDAFVRENGIHSVIVAPLLIAGEVAGAITVYDTAVDAFSDADGLVLQALADQASVTITNARLIEQLERSAAEIRRRADAESTLRHIAANISALRDSEVILQQTVDEAKRLLDSHDARIDVLEDGRLVWKYTSADSRIEAIRALEDPGFEIGQGVAGLVVAEGRPYRCGNYLADTTFAHTAMSDAFVRAANIHSVIAVPLIGESGPLGVISVATDRADAYDESHTELLQSLAEQAAIAIQNARLIEALERSQVALARRAETERSLREMAARIAELREADDLLPRIVEESRRLLGSDGAHLTRMSDDETYVVPVVVSGGLDQVTESWLKQLRFPVMAGINGLAAGTGEAVWTTDYTADERIPLEVDDLDTANRLGLRGMAAAPLRSPEGRIIGTLAVSFREPHTFDADEIAILQGLGDHAAIALTNTSLYARLRESEVRYRYLVQNSPDLVWSVDADARFSFLSDTCERLTGWKPEELLGRHFGAIVHESSRDVAEVDWTAGIQQNAELRGRLNLLHRDGHPIPAEFIGIASLDANGAFVGANGSVRDMTERERLERDLRGQAAELAAGEERAHLARELHDSVTQALFSMGLLTRTTELLLDRDPAGARDQLGSLRELQREALAEMRALIFELRPGNLEENGLVHALRTHSAALQGRIGLAIVVDSQVEERLPIEIEEVLYRIAQEALHNVVKHAGARQVRLGLDREDGLVVMRVVDDGRGFDPSRVAEGHLGLAGMRARAERIGASLDVRSRPGRGTTVEVRVAPAAASAE